VTQSNASDSLKQPARITGVVLIATTIVIAVVTAFVVATDIFLILFLALLFGVFLVLPEIKCLVTLCVENSLALIDEAVAAMEPERLGHFSLGQGNPRMRMDAAPGCCSV